MAVAGGFRLAFWSEDAATSRTAARPGARPLHPIRGRAPGRLPRRAGRGVRAVPGRAHATPERARARDGLRRAALQRADQADERLRPLHPRRGTSSCAAARARRREHARQLAEQLNSQLRLRFRTGDDDPAGRLRVASELLDSDHPAHQAAGNTIYAAAKRAERLVERDERLRAGQHPGNADGRYRAACTYAERWGLETTGTVDGELVVLLQVRCWIVVR